MIENSTNHSLDNIVVLGIFGGFTPRHVHTSRDYGRIVPRVTIAEGNYIAGCLRLPRPTSVPALTLTLSTLSSHSNFLLQESLAAILDLTLFWQSDFENFFPAIKYISLVTKPLENISGIIFRGVRVDVCIHRQPNISACNQHNFIFFISKCSFLQQDYNETSF